MTPHETINNQDCCFNLRKAARAVTMFFDIHLKSADIRSTQFTVLVALMSASGKTLTEIAEELIMERTTLSRNLKPLEKAELIAPVKFLDLRTKGYVLTEKGRMCIEKGIPLWRQAQQHIFEQFGNDQYRHFLEELSMMVSFSKMVKM